MKKAHSGTREEVFLEDPFELSRPPGNACLVRLERSAIEELLRGPPIHPGPKRVSAALISAEGAVLGIAENAGENHRSGHAEIRLLHGLEEAGIPIPRGATLVVSLRPCAMCAGAIFSACAGVWPIRVRFLEDDPGPASRNSCLFPGSDLWRRAGCPELDVERA